MSGGRLDYLYRKVEEVAERLAEAPQTPLRRALVSHVGKVAEAIRTVEWVDSGDYSPGDEDEAIRAVLGKRAPELELAEIVAAVGECRDSLDRWVKALQGSLES